MIPQQRRRPRSLTRPREEGWTRSGGNNLTTERRHHRITGGDGTGGKLPASLLTEYVIEYRGNNGGLSLPYVDAFYPLSVITRNGIPC